MCNKFQDEEFVHEVILTRDISFGDCDPAGIVFYPNVFRWMDAGREVRCLFTHSDTAIVAADLSQLRALMETKDV